MPPKYPNSDSQNQWEKMFFETIRDSLDDDVFCLSEFVLMGHKLWKAGLRNSFKKRSFCN